MPLLTLRTHVSAYLPSDFVDRERQRIESLGLEYTTDWTRAQTHTGPLILLTNSNTPATRLMQLGPHRVALVAHPNSGYDNFDAQFVGACQGPIILGNAIRAQAVAEYALKALLMGQAPLPHSPEWDPHRQWQRRTLGHMNVQLIGHGHIGKILAQALRPLARNCWVHDPHEGLRDLHWDQADAVIFACGLNSGTRRMMDFGVIEQLKDDVHVINPARGGLIDEDALGAFLRSHPKARASLDVYENEPRVPETLKGLPNALLTSHVAGVFDGLEARIQEFTHSVLVDFQKLSPEAFKAAYQKQLLQSRLLCGELI